MPENEEPRDVVSGAGFKGRRRKRLTDAMCKSRGASRQHPYGHQSKPIAIYCISCPETGKEYVGQSACVGHRWTAHQKAARRGESGALYADMRRFGFDGFKFEILYFCAGLAAANIAEGREIAFRACTEPGGYNRCAGGNFGSKGRHSIREAMRWAERGCRTPEEIAKWRANNGRKTRESWGTAWGKLGRPVAKTPAQRMRAYRLRKSGEQP